MLKCVLRLRQLFLYGIILTLIDDVLEELLEISLARATVVNRALGRHENGLVSTDCAVELGNEAEQILHKGDFKSINGGDIQLLSLLIAQSGNCYADRVQIGVLRQRCLQLGAEKLFKN